MRFLFAAMISVMTAGTAMAEPFRVECGLPVGTNCVVQSVIAKHWDGAADLELRHSQTLTKSAILLAADRIDASVMLPATYLEMLGGAGVFAVAPEKSQAAAQNLRALFSFVDGYTHFLVDADAAGDMRAVIENKQVFVGPPSGTALSVYGAVLEVATGGLKIGEDFEPVALGWGSGQQAFAGGKLDVFIRPMPLGLPLIAGISQFRQLRLVGFSDEEMARMEAAGIFRLPGLSPGVIPGGIYPQLANADETVNAIAYALIQTVSVAMSEEDAYAATKAFWENVEAEKASNPILAQLNPAEPFTALNMPLHPGAARYYREVGIEIPEAIAPR